MKSLFSLLVMSMFIGQASFASNVNWTRLWSCERDQVELLRSEIWGYGSDGRVMYMLDLKKDHAIDHLSTLFRSTFADRLNMLLVPTEEFGKFTSTLSIRGGAFTSSVVVTQESQNGSLLLEFFENESYYNKMGEYRFYDCTF